MTGSRKPLKFWSLTVYSNFGPPLFPNRMKDILNEFADSWVFQLERGVNADKLHFQVRLIVHEGVMTETLLTIFEARSLDRRDITFLPESNNSIQQGGLSFYVMKDDTRVEGPWHDSTYKPRKRVHYEGNDLECIRSSKRPFQQHIIDELKHPPDDRTLHWWYNHSGAGGKSKLMKYLRVTHPSFARVPMGTATQIKTSVIEKGPCQVYMVDLPRVRGTDERQQELFSALEEIKNGWVESPMYGKAAELIMEPPHIYIFSNELPNLNYASLDRWRVHELYDLDGEQAFRELTLEQVVAMQNPVPRPP